MLPFFSQQYYGPCTDQTDQAGGERTARTTGKKREGRNYLSYRQYQKIDLYLKKEQGYCPYMAASTEQTTGTYTMDSIVVQMNLTKR